ncbi:juvenile hormone esterase-like [Anopheles ziemanni]|uniref:juvenile hormone esterase-like n=1 Tax=Anopheles coustani TaxID=139045 RepID=UPI002658BA3B|nr:juvenile hormone esterase-like [Anopheles coustani]XP_058167971.1 juvenile hormone esterase-like [Anopheles ziemanni]
MSLGVLVVPVFLVLSSSATVSTGRPAAQNVPRVCIEEGCLRGTWMRSVQGERFQAFIGIPYAKPPIGELRFADPVPNSRWEEDELDTTGRFPRAPCLQHNLFLPGRGVEGKEDCLYLNVYRSEKSRKDIDSNVNTTSTALPTIVYIHGGGYMAGYTSPLVSGAEKLMDHSVILVTVAYRLGAFGFLSTGDEAASGNFGLKDQRLALRWVSRNIQAFGGDPQLVTIMGQSAGGASVQLQMMHLGNEGLFQRAISLSGSALSVWSTPRPDPERLARHQAALVGVEGADTMSTSELVQALRAVDADLFVRNFAGFTNGSRYPMIVYGPTVEKATVKDAFLTETPLKLWSQGAILHTPWLTGTLPNDGFVFSAPILRESDCSKDTLSQQQTLLLNVLRGAHNSNAFPLLKERFFTNATSVGECFTKENIHIITKIFNEAFFVYPMTLSVQQHLHHKTKANTSGAPVYLYQFNYQGQNSYSSIFVNEEDESVTRDFGIVHCDELLYIFRAPVLFPDFQRGSPDAKVSHRFTKFLVDFARTG